MSPAARFNALIASLTVLAMYYVIRHALPLSNPANAQPIIGGIATFFLSIGLYRLLALILRWALERSLHVKRWIFGSSFVHGTWIGWFIGHAGDRRYIVAKYEQDLDGLNVSGQSFTSEGKLHGSWSSNATNIDSRRGRLTFTYAFDVGTRTGTLEGVTTFQFQRTASHHPPTGFTGYAHDLSDTVRIEVHEQKLSDELLEWTVGLGAARTRFP